MEVTALIHLENHILKIKDKIYVLKTKNAELEATCTEKTKEIQDRDATIKDLEDHLTELRAVNIRLQKSICDLIEKTKNGVGL